MRFVRETNKQHEILLEPRIQRIRWSSTRACAGHWASFEILTALVGDGAALHVDVRTIGGRMLGVIRDVIVRNRFVGEVEIPEDCPKGTEILLEASLPGNGVEGTSNVIPVVDPPIIEKMAWSAAEARRGDALTLTARISGLHDGTPVTMVVYEYDRDRHHDRIVELPGRVRHGQVEVHWKFEYQNDVDEIPTQEEVEAYGETYNPPEYFFTIRVGELEFGLDQDSGLLRFRDWIELRIRHPDGSPAAGWRYRVNLPDGDTREGELDQDGYAREEDVPPGPYKVSILEPPPAGESEAAPAPTPAGVSETTPATTSEELESQEDGWGYMEFAKEAKEEYRKVYEKKFESSLSTDNPLALDSGENGLRDFVKKAPPREPTRREVRMKYLGTNSLFITDGETNLLVDPYFSRPNAKPNDLDAEIEPDAETIENALKTAGIDRVDAILVTHSHWDHSLDIAEISNYLKKPEGDYVPIYGDVSVANVALGGYEKYDKYSPQDSGVLAHVLVKWFYGFSEGGRPELLSVGGTAVVGLPFLVAILGFLCGPPILRIGGLVIAPLVATILGIVLPIIFRTARKFREDRETLKEVSKKDLLIREVEGRYNIHLVDTADPQRCTFEIGKFEVEFRESKHAWVPFFGDCLDGPITAPLTPPATIEHYQEGTTHCIKIKHKTIGAKEDEEGGVILIGGSANFVQDDLKGVNADVLILPVAGLEMSFQQIMGLLTGGATKVPTVMWGLEEIFGSLKDLLSPDLKSLHQIFKDLSQVKGGPYPDMVRSRIRRRRSELRSRRTRLGERLRRRARRRAAGRRSRLRGGGMRLPAFIRRAGSVLRRAISALGSRVRSALARFKHWLEQVQLAIAVALSNAFSATTETIVEIVRFAIDAHMELFLTDEVDARRLGTTRELTIRKLSWLPIPNSSFSRTGMTTSCN